MEYLVVSVRFLLDEFHGRDDRDEPEWPPSPLRLFQALVNASARQDRAEASGVLEWLERQPTPVIVATPPAAIQPRYGAPFYVPNNDGDLWFGKDNKDTERAQKNVRPTRLQEDAVVHYLWPLTDTDEFDLSACKRIVSAISAFGWGIDMVVVDAALISQEEAQALAGEQWLPVEMGGGVPLRVPIQGTLADLRERYTAFCNRISLEKDTIFCPVRPLAAYAIREYRKSSEMAEPPYAVFELRKLGNTVFASYDTARKGLQLGGMLRHCATCIAPQMGWDEKRVKEFVLGHGESRSEAHKPVDGPRLVFIPLPSIEFRGKTKGRTIGPIRRVLVTVCGANPASEFNAIVRALEGQELIDEKSGAPVAFLRRASPRENAIADYLSEGCAWESVTPVVLPGYDDPRKLRRKLNEAMLSPQEKASIVEKLELRIETLLRKALLQSGFTPAVVGDTRIYWRGSGFLQGTDLATNYTAPEQCRRYRRLHCRIEFSKPIRGPLCIGKGRYFGLGLFAVVPEASI
ncbi:MAG TPA: type I-U CRISPR-associated protein Csb2 [Candidatus Latescibacteria bacterium]|nr:type I-U CRISPR-associated protein Csb2 [Candidatus Latescibacterota bacterium]